MTKTSTRENSDVTEFLFALNHPLSREIQLLRKLILNTNTVLVESLKWNAPNFSLHGVDVLTIRLYPPNHIQLVFHRGAKVQPLPHHRLIRDDTGILSWRTNDRAIATFRNLEEISTQEKLLAALIDKWLGAVVEVNR